MPSDASALRTVGKYDLLDQIAEGGMGMVFKARNRHTGQIVALKLVSPQMAKNVVLRKRLENEFRAASTLDHPNIVRGLEFGQVDDRAFLVMEFIEGESLGTKLDRVGKLPEMEALRLIGQVAQGLHFAHKQGMIHRDVKPDNILISADGQAKLADLGLVKEVDAEINLTRTGRGLGTPHFMAPEQFRNAKNADVRCDIYSLGATLYQMVTGVLPFRSHGPLEAWMKKINNEFAPPRTLIQGLSERTDSAICRAMDPDPNQRPQSCREFMEDLTGHGTRKNQAATSSIAPIDLWYLAYRDEEGVTHTVKGTTTAIRKSLQEGLLGDALTIRACRTKAGPFEFLHALPEFRDLVTGPDAKTRPAPAVSRSPTHATGNESTAPRIPLEVSGARRFEWMRLGIIAMIVVVAGLTLFSLIYHK